MIIDEAAKSMDVIVPDDQLSLAIGRKGQNVRLAVQLTGWRIDIKSESKMRELAQWLSEAVSVVEGCGDAVAELLLQQGITSLEDLSQRAACRPASTGWAPARSSSGRASSRAQEDRRRGSSGRSGEAGGTAAAAAAAAAASAAAAAAAPEPAPAEAGGSSATE